MTMERARRTRPKLSDTAKACREAQDEISRFYGWTGSSDVRMGNDWRQQVAAAVLSGSTVADAVQTVKDEWIGRCRRERIKPRAERTGDGVASRLRDVIREAYRGATPAVAALMYRHAASDFPTEAAWLLRWADLWESWGDTWQPMPGVDAGPRFLEQTTGGLS